MERVNSLLNTYDPGSDVSHINQQAGGAPVPLSPETDGGAEAGGFFLQHYRRSA